MGSLLDQADRARLTEICDRYGIAEPLVFGSAARGDDHLDSDVDILYTLRPGTHLGWEIEDLSQLIGGPVDLVAKRALHRRIRDDVLAEARPIYEAA